MFYINECSHSSPFIPLCQMLFQSGTGEDCDNRKGSENGNRSTRVRHTLIKENARLRAEVRGGPIFFIGQPANK